MLRLGASLLSIALFAAISAACAWDRDTLAEESRASKEPLAIIVGHFERNPPLYYEMRLNRVAKELQANPRDFNLYDDAGVSSDRLGRHDEAIRWMERKAKAMGGGGTKDDRYRFHANLGTFYAHRWFSTKQDHANAKDLDLGIHHIRKAIEINPDAHFGREAVQLDILEWVKTNPKAEPDDIEYSTPALGHHLQDLREKRSAKASATVNGLLGLIRLGNAWESVDVFAALAVALGRERKGSVAILALERAKELERMGRRAHTGERFSKAEYVEGASLGPEQRQAVKEYHRLRREADEWHRNRTDFMLAKLRAGSHPDTDPAFWSGYKESEIEVVDLPFYQKTKVKEQAMLVTIVGCLLSIPALTIWLVVRAIRRAKSRNR